MGGLPTACIAAAICAFSTTPYRTVSMTLSTTPAIRPPIRTFCMLILPIVAPLERGDSVERITTAAATVGNRTAVVKSQHVQDREQAPHAIGNDGHTGGHNPFAAIDYQVEVVGAGRQLQRRFPDVISESAQRRGSPAVPVAGNGDRVRDGHAEAHHDGVAAMLRDQRLELWLGWRARWRCRERAPRREDSEAAGRKTGARQALERVAEVITSRCLDGNRRCEEVLQRYARRSARGGGPAHPATQPQRCHHARPIDGHAADQVAVPGAEQARGFDAQRELRRSDDLPPAARAHAQRADTGLTLDDTSNEPHAQCAVAGDDFE